jgi:hypothetical protein
MRGARGSGKGTHCAATCSERATHKGNTPADIAAVVLPYNSRIPATGLLLRSASKTQALVGAALGGGGRISVVGDKRRLSRRADGKQTVWQATSPSVSEKGLLDCSSQT